jgi:hypothetical protein
LEAPIRTPHFGTCTTGAARAASPCRTDYRQERGMDQWGGIVIFGVAVMALGVAIIDIVRSGWQGRKSDRG